MLKKFTVEAIVGNVSDIKPTREWISGGFEGNITQTKIGNQTIIFIAYGEMPQIVRDNLTATLNYCIASQMNQGLPIGKKYELSEIIDS